MRKFFLVLFSLGLLAVLAVAAAVPLLTKIVAPDLVTFAPPKGLPLGQRDFPLPERSEVAIYLELPVKVLAAAANQHTPKELAGTEFRDIHPKISDTTLQWRLRPGTIAMNNTGQDLTFHLPVKGDAFSTGKFGKLRLPVKGSAVLGGVVSGRMNPLITSDWQVEPGLTTSTKVTQADVTLGRFGTTDARDQVEESLKPMLQREIQKIGPGLTQSLNLKQGIQKLWDQAHVSRKLPLQPDTWVVFDPSLARVGPLDYSRPENISVTVGMVAQSYISNTAAQEREPEKLPSLEMVSVNPVTDIRVPVVVNFEQLNTSLAGRTFQIRTQLGKGFVISKPWVDLGPQPGVLKIGMDVAAPNGTWLESMGGHLIVTARPIIDCPTLTLGFVDVKTAVESKESLCGVAAWLFEEMLIKTIEKEIRIDLREYLPKLENEIHKIVTSLPVPGHIDFGFKKPSVSLLGAYTVNRSGWNLPASPGIVFVLGATTEISVRVNRL